jgi:glyoxylase-like metal-dependent hydrolase (beta-lactamase superfamily II)
VHLNCEEIRAIHLAHGHTDGDSIIIFTKSNVVHMGDDFVTYGFPFVDLASGGSVRGLIASLDKIIPQLPPGAKVIPGHGGVSTVDDMKKFAATLKEIVGIVEAEVKKGRSLDAIKKDHPLKKWEATWGGAFVKADDFIEIVHSELASKDGKFMPH